MSCDLVEIATIASPIVGTIAIVVALIISHRSSRDAQRQIDEVKQSTEKQIEALKDIIEHQAYVHNGNLLHYQMQTKFELLEEERDLSYVRIVLDSEKRKVARNRIKELELQEQLLELRIKNRKELLENYEAISEQLDKITEALLSGKPISELFNAEGDEYKGQEEAKY